MGATLERTPISFELVDVVINNHRVDYSAEIISGKYIYIYNSCLQIRSDSLKHQYGYLNEISQYGYILSPNDHTIISNTVTQQSIIIIKSSKSCRKFAFFRREDNFWYSNISDIPYIFYPYHVN